MQWLIRFSTDFLIRRGAVDPADREVYEYGLHGIFTDALQYGVLLVVSLLIGRLPQTVAFHIAFIPLRGYAGGFHAKTQLRCFLLSTGLWLAALAAIDLLQTMRASAPCIALVSCVVIWLLAPVVHEANPIGPETQRAARKRARVYATVFFAASALATWLLPVRLGWLPASLAMGMALVAALACLAQLIAAIKTRRAR